MSSNDACHGGVSPLRGDESPPHKRFHAELSVDPDVETPEIPSSPETNDCSP